MSQQQLYTNIFGPANEGKDDLRLLDITKKYPYYSVAQYFVLKHTDKNDDAYAKIAGRTALHFNNPYYLTYLLHTDHAPQIAAQDDEDGAKEIIESGPIRSIEKDVIGASSQTEDSELVFEPLHTTDYFASQGIKLSDEVKPDDKLGKQLRSFTDWLKTMKKVHEQRLPAGNATLDLNVQTIAEKSNQEEEVITESMADVYKEQGKNRKAREIYQKLSLLDPSKSAYFAAKIDSLKDL